MIGRIYVEIGNICNLHCSFCPSTTREARRMTKEEFELVCKRVKGKTKQLFFHVMGEPLFHPELATFLDIAKSYDFKTCITTNGTLIKLREEELLARADAIHRISISLHSIEGNGAENALEKYLETVIDFAKRAAERGIYVVLRLWNLDSTEKDGKNDENEFIEGVLGREFPEEWQKRWSGYRLAKGIFLEYAGIFTWPSESEAEEREEGFCHGLTDQIAILADGTVVPCCLDSEGIIDLGNIFTEELDTILSSERAVRMRSCFEQGKMAEELCKKCTYARRFKSK